MDVDQDELIGIHFQLCGNIFGKDSKRNFYSDLFIFDNISGGVVCIWENRDSGSRLYVCMYGMSFRRGCSDTGVSDRVFWILSTTVVF